MKISLGLFCVFWTIAVKSTDRSGAVKHLNLRICSTGPGVKLIHFSFKLTESLRGTEYPHMYLGYSLTGTDVRVHILTGTGAAYPYE